MIRSILKNTQKINKNIGLCVACGSSAYRTSDGLLTQKIQYQILQNSKRLNSFSIPQQQEIKHIDNDIFNDAVLAKLIRIESAFKQILQSPMNNTNPIKIKEIKKNSLYSLQIVTDKGSFVFEGFEDLSTLFYTSPVSGVYKYFYGQDQDRFLNNKDKHILDQCLSRQVLEKFNVVLEL